MNQFWQFANEHPFITLVAFWIAVWACIAPLNLAFRTYNRTLRARNIRLHGWPKAPMDADGDIIYPDKEEE